MTRRRRVRVSGAGGLRLRNAVGTAVIPDTPASLATWRSSVEAWPASSSLPGGAVVA